MRRTLLLACGLAASVLYIAMNIFVPTQWAAYSSFSQTISELSAFDAPTRPLWVPLGIVYTLLVAAFGVGVWKAAQGNRSLRVVGGLFVANGLIGLGWPPMHQRVVLAAGGGTLSDTMHIVWSAVTVVLMMLEIGFAATALDRRFRRYSIATMAVLFVFGALTFWSAPGVAANLPTPWLGVWERINVLGFMVWQAALAIVLLGPRATKAHASDFEPVAKRSVPAPFRTPKGEAAFLAAYDAAMKLWPVPYEEMDIPSPFGTTHVVAAGPKNAPPMVLLHGYMATSVMWSSNVAAFAEDYRVYAVDTMGQPSKSIPGEPIRSAADYVAWLTATLDGLHIDRFTLVGMSFGGWLALTYAVAAPERVQELVLLSAGGVLTMAQQFRVRGMLMVFFPTRFTVNSFMRWAGFTSVAGERDARSVLNVMYLGIKHFRMPPDTLRVAANAASQLSDDDLRALRVPVLLLLGSDEVLFDAPTALARARRLIPDFEGDLIPHCRHDMCFSQHRIVDARVLDFLKRAKAAREDHPPERAVA